MCVVFQYQNKTSFFRNDLDWNSLVKFLNIKYKDTNNVHIINTACSDGTKAFSLAVILMEKLKADTAIILLLIKHKIILAIYQI